MLHSSLLICIRMHGYLIFTAITPFIPLRPWVRAKRRAYPRRSHCADFRLRASSIAVLRCTYGSVTAQRRATHSGPATAGPSKQTQPHRHVVGPLGASESLDTSGVWRPTYFSSPALSLRAGNAHPIWPRPRPSSVHAAAARRAAMNASRAPAARRAVHPGHSDIAPARAGLCRRAPRE